MNRQIRLFLTAASLFGFAAAALAQTPTPPLQLPQPPLLVNSAYQLGLNWQSVGGVPISSTATNGSDGRYSIASGPSTFPASPGQFRSFMGFGGITAQKSTNLIPNSTFFANVTNLNWPRALGTGSAAGTVALVLRSAQVGASFFGQNVSFSFGSVITPPTTDENGQPLAQAAIGNYWFGTPYTTNNFTNAPYYWSPNAQAVFATQPGNIAVTWKKFSPTDVGANGFPADYKTNNYALEAGHFYRLNTLNYLVATAPVKTPQKMYWTEGTFQKVGHAITVPAARVSAVNVVYNTLFPKRVPSPYVDPNQVTQLDATNTVNETRTLWFDSDVGTIRSYNAEGRVFVELLGELNADQLTRRFLGFEIVTVVKQASPDDVVINLGERLTARQDGSDDSALYPTPIVNVGGQTFYYQQSLQNTPRPNFYADRETINLNDLQMHWLITGVAGLQWPYIFDRYHQVWPSDPSMYSFYTRPLVGSDAEAQKTAVQLPSNEAPSLDYQDPIPVPYGAKLPQNHAFYTWLDQAHPAHRSLLRFNVGDQVAFERIFSVLDTGLKTNSIFAGSFATNLTGWNPTNKTFNFPSKFDAPYVYNAAVNVGDRILPPSGELGSSDMYWAGYIRQTSGNSFNPGAYIDPFTAGFTAANRGAIIPVNAIPGNNALEVWWFRSAGADPTNGFVANYWPSVIGHYSIQWPTGTPEIVLASNDGSGPLDSLRANGSIYVQNDPAQPGYNPNEEHALMLAGQAYALRDDLNKTNSPGYSSDPFVLIDYTEADGRPAMSLFKVRREKPEAGLLFDYVIEAGNILQAPMPLPLLATPLAGTLNYNQEVSSLTVGDLPVGWTSDQVSGPFARYSQFTFQDRKNNFWVYRGLHAGLPDLQIGKFDTNSGSFGPLTKATALVDQQFTYYVHSSRRVKSLTLSANLPDGLSFQADTNGLGLIVTGAPAVTGSNTYTLIVQDTDGSQTSAPFSLAVLPATYTGFFTNGNTVTPFTNLNAVTTQGPMFITSTNQYSGAMVTYYDRPPQLAQPPAPTNSFTMRFYYKTLPGFAWPGQTAPPTGAIVPYLRPYNGQGGFAGDATSSNTASLNIVYRPVWPGIINGQPVPTLQSGQTLTVSQNGMAGVRGQSSVEVLYEQSISQDVTDAPHSVALFDPTVQKTSSLLAHSLNGVPASIVTQLYLGKTYFPNLPPNLVDRVFYDPGTSNLVFQGQFKDEVVGDKYILLNVLRGADLDAVKALCPDSDKDNVGNWAAMVDDLSTPVYTFFKNTNGVYVNNPALTVTNYAGDVVRVLSSDTQVDSYALSATGPGKGYITYIAGNGHSPAHAGEPVSVYIARVTPPLFPGQLKIILSPNPLSELISFQHTLELAGASSEYEYDWRIMPPVDGQAPKTDPTNWTALTFGKDINHYTLGGPAGIQALGDNYVAVRYRSTNPLADPANTNWSDWTDPALAEGWIKRVLAGINPFNQRTADLFNNPANTTGNIITQAGHRWEGDVALNLDTINNFGLIEIYETVLHRGEGLSINSGINYGPANDALLLAAGYLNDLYMMLGNEAWSDAANPTIGIGTADKTYGNIATSLFAFKGQVPSLLEEEMALLRGRDDFLAPGATLAPVYNRLFWNYTRGIDAGEVIYALNYNILDQNQDGVVNAADAAVLYPQGHGDAYGHYLTAVANYYSLLMNPKFDWVPRIEAVSILGATVAVDYQDERKFAAAAAALARTGRQVFDLTWRQNYQAGTTAGWSAFEASRVNPDRSYDAAGVPSHVTRYWGMDHWAWRVGQGSYINWVVGNSILPPVDPDPSHEGIQKVDRTTVPELAELPQTAAQLQTDMDNAEAGFTPLGLSQDSVPFDINPLQVTGSNPQTHFEQIYQRAIGTLNNAVVAFDDAQNVTQLMRSEEDSLADFQNGVNSQEIAYNDSLVELYGSPYPDDMGPGKTYAQGYAGPDLLHYTYVENPDTNNYGGTLADPTISQTFNVDIQQLPSDWTTKMYSNFNFIVEGSASNYSQYVSFNVGPNGFFDKPSNWLSPRATPGEVQQAISALIAARDKLRQECNNAVYDKWLLDKAMFTFQAQLTAGQYQLGLITNNANLQQTINDIQAVYSIENKISATAQGIAQDVATTLISSIPTTVIGGLAFGGNIAQPAAGAAYALAINVKDWLAVIDAVGFTIAQSSVAATQQSITDNANLLANSQLDEDTKNAVLSVASQLGAVQGHCQNINQDLRNLDDAQRAYQALVAKGNQIQQERLTFRQHAASLVQGYRTRDAAFRIFQNEKLTRYKTLFDLAAKYAFLAANAYDYETGLLNTDQGKAFVGRIISSRALGVVNNGVPQYAGSSTGDPGLSSALAEMKADWDVLKGRLGFNNPDGYGTTVSLRTENYRILSGTNGDDNWMDVLQQGRTPNLLLDSDVKRYCLQLDNGSGLPVPGLVLTFSTVISDGLNLFGQELSPGDHNYSPSSFATKIFAAGVDFDGYIGMDNPSVGSIAGGITPPDPTLDPNALAATPYVYLIPVGTDSMRSPPLGDSSTVRNWNVDDLTIPLPFNVSASDLSSAPFYSASDSLSEPLFGIRKHQAFRPVSTTAAFNTSIYGAGGELLPSQYTNKRLIGRSIWNSKWKLVIPGKTLLADPNKGLDRFIQSVRDVKLYFITYSYSGN